MDSSLVAYVTGAVAVAGGAFFLLSQAKRLPECPQPGQKMKKIMLVEPNADMNKVKLSVEEVPVPMPKPGEVLVKVSAAPVNPSDYGGWLGRQPGLTYPKPIGNEGAGKVVASGGGFLAGRLVGKNVGIIAQATGSYGEYVCVDALKGAFPIDDAAPEDAASFFVNPYTVLAILDTARSKHKSRALVHTAAASQLGQMMVKLAPSQGMTIVNVVRRTEQAKILKDLGAEYVIVQEDKDWQAQLGKLISTLKIKVAFDCIAGEMSGTLVQLMPNGSTTYVYGGLSKTPVGNIPVMDLIYKKKQVKGFLLTNWVLEGGLLSMLSRLRKAASIVNPGLRKGGWAESQFVDCTLESMQTDFLKMWNTSGFTGAKLRIRM